MKFSGNNFLNNNMDGGWVYKVQESDIQNQ